MKIKIYIIMAVGTLFGVSAMAQNVNTAAVGNGGEVCGVEVESALLKRNADLMTAYVKLNLDDFDLKSNRAAVFAPVIVNGADSVELDPVGLYGRSRWYQYLRTEKYPLGGDAETSIRYSKRPDTYTFAQSVEYQEWMNGSQLFLRRYDFGCCHTIVDEQEAPLTGYRETAYKPDFRYARPIAVSEKTHELAGRAYIDFPVNRTEIYPDYRKNPVELAKIIATIDSIRNDKDVTVKGITIKGYASPEGTYENNTRLAKGRTATLKQYVGNLYHFDNEFIATDYEPEDWAGLRAYVETSGLAHRTEILEIIDSNMQPDPKERKIKSSYPDEYKFLLQNVYPGLRHSDYRIEYTVRSFSDVKEIAELMRTQPQKLNLNEMMLLAQSLEPGTPEYSEVFETAVRLFPEDETANLNAANAAMERGDLISAEKYLAKAGSGAETIYARGVLAALQGDYNKAEELVRSAGEAGMADTDSVLEHLKDVKIYAPQK